ncbi:class I SAM-dependent methyltransferase [Spirochaeta cellobiosiphila]|uniref:class I SAM-dependent methyltransferase n=1 Tax=Spirochaeta cellobiosiphila TaxID=504483 RepID=UPI00040FDE95|nr:class I SAM-dependent methyltransferase [Spirochaeta cellobiosiphila]
MEAFENRIRKRYKHFKKWARRQNYEAFRFYDNDVPGFPYIIEEYGNHISLTEYEKEHLPEEVVNERNDKVLALIKRTFDIDDNHLHFRQRKKQSGSLQYNKKDHGKKYVIRETDLSFHIDLDSYLDTGLFLDHRISRQNVRSLSSGKRVLNLFCYTGSFSVYAASGGAIQVDSVDLSNTYLDWARENFELNNLDIKKHKFIREDILKWLSFYGEPYYDIIVLDPPTFSNSKKMNQIFDVSKDHLFLIRRCMDRLKSDGILLFSNNYRKFTMDPQILDQYLVKETTHLTIPNDFQDKKIHYSFEIRHNTKED